MVNQSRSLWLPTKICWCLNNFYLIILSSLKSVQHPFVVLVVGKKVDGMAKASKKRFRGRVSLERLGVLDNVRGGRLLPLNSRQLQRPQSSMKHDDFFVYLFLYIVEVSFINWWQSVWFCENKMWVELVEVERLNKFLFVSFF